VSLVLEAIVDVAGVEVGLVSAAGGKRGGVFEGAWTCPLLIFSPLGSSWLSTRARIRLLALA
jgi:hypothetical protein